MSNRAAPLAFQIPSQPNLPFPSKKPETRRAFFIGLLKSVQVWSGPRCAAAPALQLHQQLGLRYVRQLEFFQCASSQIKANPTRFKPGQATFEDAPLLHGLM